MGHKRKDTISQKPVEWGKHLHPYEKNQVARSERRAAKTFIRRTKDEIIDELIIDVRAIVVKDTSEEWVSEYGLALNDEVTEYYNQGHRSARKIASYITQDIEAEKY